MNVIRIHLNREKFNQLPKADKIFFIGLGHIFNEINAITKMLYWACNSPKRNEAEENGQFSMILLIIKILSGKLLESWNLFQSLFFGTGISKEYDPKLSGEPKEDFKKLKKYFGKENHISTIRNNFGFHYSPDKSGELLNRIKGNLDIYLDRGKLPNNLFYFAEILDAAALVDDIGFEVKNNNIEEELIKLSDELLQVGKWFLSVADGLMDLIINKIGRDNKEGEIESLKFENLSAFEDVYIPWFTYLK